MIYTDKYKIAVDFHRKWITNPPETAEQWKVCAEEAKNLYMLNKSEFMHDLLAAVYKELARNSKK